MPKISRGGVSNRLVDPDYIAPPGEPPEQAIDTGRPDVGQPSKEQPEVFPGKALYAEADETTENKQDKPVDERDPDPGAGDGSGATVGKPAPRNESAATPAKKTAPAKKAQPSK